MSLLRAVVGMVVLVTLAAPAAAQRVVIESYPGPEPRDADRILSAAVTELQSLGFSRAAADAPISKPARILTPTEMAGLESLVQDGTEHFNAAKIDEAIATLERALALQNAAIATGAADTDFRKLRMETLIRLAQSYKRASPAKPAEITAAMGEVLRSFPDFDISTRTHGYEPVEMRSSVAKEIGAEGRGTLVVEVDEPQAVIFVNERYAGVGQVEMDGLYPGRYRVFTKSGSQSGRIHEVEVEAGQTARLAVQWQFDAALQGSAAGLHLSFASQSQQEEQLPRLAHRLARKLGADEILVLGIRTVDGRRTVVGHLFSKESTRFLRRGAVTVEPAVPTDKLRALARFLAGDDDAGRLVDRVVLGGSGAAETGGSLLGGSARESGGSSALGVWKWVTLGGGVAALGTGGVLWALHEPLLEEDGSRNPYARDTKTAGIITMAAGGALTALSVYFFIADAGDDEAAETGAFAVAPWAGADGVGFTAAGRF